MVPIIALVSNSNVWHLLYLKRLIEQTNRNHLARSFIQWALRLDTIKSADFSRKGAIDSSATTPKTGTSGSAALLLRRISPSLISHWMMIPTFSCVFIGTSTTGKSTFYVYMQFQPSSMQTVLFYSTFLKIFSYEFLMMKLWKFITMINKLCAGLLLGTWLYTKERCLRLFSKSLWCQ